MWPELQLWRKQTMLTVNGLSFTVSSWRPWWRWQWWGTGCVAVRPQGWNGIRDADDSSPHGALFHRVHGRTLRTVEDTGELVKLGHAANHSAVGEDTEPQGVSQNALSEQASHKLNCLFNSVNSNSNSPQSDLTNPWSAKTTNVSQSPLWQPQTHVYFPQHLEKRVIQH